MCVAELMCVCVCKDDGSTTACCSGVITFPGPDKGISTLPSGTADDDDVAVSDSSPIIPMVDWGA